MIHYWECRICTNRWTTACFQHDDNPEYHHRQLTSGLCHSCFDEFEKSDSEALHIFNLLMKLEHKNEEFDRICGVFGQLTAAIEMSLERTPEEEARQEVAFQGLRKWRKEAFGRETLGNRFFQHCVEAGE